MQTVRISQDYGSVHIDSKLNLADIIKLLAMSEYAPGAIYYIVLGSGFIENEDRAASRRKVLDKIQSIISNPNTPSATSYPLHTVIPGANVFKLISNNSEIIELVTNESQVHLTRVVARFATTCINNRKKFVESLAST